MVKADNEKGSTGLFGEEECKEPCGLIGDYGRGESKQRQCSLEVYIRGNINENTVRDRLSLE